MSNGIAAFGTLLKIGDGATPEDFTPIEEVVNITGPGLSTDPIDMTHQGSPGKCKEFIAGLKDGGEVTFDLNYIPTAVTHNATAGLINDWENGTKRNFQLVFPDIGNTTWAVTALVTGFEPSAPVEDKLAASVTLKVSGQPTLV